MKRTLRGIFCAEIRRNWSDLGRGARGGVFDTVWDDIDLGDTSLIPSAVLERLRGFCAGDELTITFDGLDNKQRKRVHRVAEVLGIDHVSSGEHPHRIIRLTKSSLWNWEFTLRDKQPEPKRSKKKKRNYDYYYNDREDREEAEFLVNYKFQAWGYNSPEDMLDGEPHLRELIEG